MTLTGNLYNPATDDSGPSLPPAETGPFEPDPGGAERGGAFGGRSLFGQPGSAWPAEQADRLRRAGSITEPEFALMGDEAKDAYAALDGLVSRINALHDAYELVAADRSDEEREIKRADRRAVEAGEPLGKVERIDWTARKDALRREHAILFEGLRRTASVYEVALKADLPLAAQALAEAVPAALARARREGTLDALTGLLRAKADAEASYRAVQLAAGHRLTYAQRNNGVNIVSLRNGIQEAMRLLQEGNEVDSGAWTLSTPTDDPWPLFRRETVAAGNSQSAVMELLAVELSERGQVTRHMANLYSRYGAAQGFGASWS